MAMTTSPRAYALTAAALITAAIVAGAGCVSRDDKDLGETAGVEIPASLANGLQPLARAVDAESMLARARERELLVQGQRVWVDVQTRDLDADHRSDFAIEGVEVRSFSTKYQRVSAAVATPAALRQLAALAVVRRIDPEYGYAQ